jgi:hypothetical protein
MTRRPPYDGLGPVQTLSISTTFPPATVTTSEWCMR